MNSFFSWTVKRAAMSEILKRPTVSLSMVHTIMYFSLGVIGVAGYVGNNTSCCDGYRTLGTYRRNVTIALHALIVFSLVPFFMLNGQKKYTVVLQIVSLTTIGLAFVAQWVLFGFMSASKQRTDADIRKDR